MGRGGVGSYYFTLIFNLYFCIGILYYLILTYAIIDDSYFNITQYIFLQSSNITYSCFYYIILFDILWHTLLYLYCTLILLCFFFTLLHCGNSILSLLWSYTFTMFICLFLSFSGLLFSLFSFRFTFISLYYIYLSRTCTYWNASD